MNKKHLKLFLTAAATLVLASCQIAPVNAQTSITNAKGAGSKTLSALVLVDGSCQIEPDTTSFPGNANYYYLEDVDFSNPTITPKADGAKVKLALDHYLTNPNQLATTQEVWNEFNNVVRSKVPSGFQFNLKEVKSSDWKDEYMDNIPDATVSAWKGYVYQVTYSWSNIDEYISKTKTLIGESYEESHLKELDDANTPWATFKKNGDGTYTFSEAWLVNYWSVYDIANQVMESEYFNRAALGADYAVTTDNAFSVALQEYKIGDGDPVYVKVDNKSGLDDQLNMKFISATGTVKEESKTGLIIGIVVAAVAVIAAVASFFVIKKKKASK